MNSVTLPILKTQRLTLRKLTAADRSSIFALRSDPEINKYLDRDPCTTEDEALNFINKVNENIDKNTAYYWAITLADSGNFAGTICLFDISVAKKSCEVGFELLRKYQKQGIMKEALQAVINFVFHTMKAENLVAAAHHNNQDSIKLLEHFNFVKSPELDDANPDLNVYLLKIEQ